MDHASWITIATFFEIAVYRELMFVGSMSIIDKNVTEDFPGWLPFFIVCINPDQFGLGDQIGQTKLQRKSNFQVLLTLERHGSFS